MRTLLLAACLSLLFVGSAVAQVPDCVPIGQGCVPIEQLVISDEIGTATRIIVPVVDTDALEQPAPVKLSRWQRIKSKLLWGVAIAVVIVVVIAGGSLPGT